MIPLRTPYSYFLIVLALIVSPRCLIILICFMTLGVAWNLSFFACSVSYLLGFLNSFDQRLPCRFVLFYLARFSSHVIFIFLCFFHLFRILGLIYGVGSGSKAYWFSYSCALFFFCLFSLLCAWMIHGPSTLHFLSVFMILWWLCWGRFKISIYWRVILLRLLDCYWLGSKQLDLAQSLEKLLWSCLQGCSLVLHWFAMV